MENPQIEVGDKVEILHYTKASERCQGHYEAGYYVGRVGWVLEIGKYHSWSSSDGMASLVLEPNDPYYMETYMTGEHRVHLGQLKVIEKGNGKRPVAGITFPLPVAYDKPILVEEFAYKMRKLDQQHQGFNNAATFLAWLYLNNDSRAHSLMQQMRRKDGTLNTNKVTKLFRDLGLKVDDWAFEIPINIPGGIERYWVVDRYRPKVNWAEVADHFKTT